MQQDDYEQFASMLGAVSELYGNNKGGVSDFAIGLWWNALVQYDLLAVRQAFDRHVKNPDTGQFMPKPADVIRMISGRTQDSALMAWAKVDRAMRYVGPYRSVVFDDPLIHRVLQEMGGWAELSRKDDEAWPFVAKEFENRYRGYRMRNEVPEYPAVMIGIAEASNSTQGFRNDPPALLGDERSAMLVLQNGTDKPLLAVTKAGALLAAPPAPAKRQEDDPEPELVEA